MDMGKARKILTNIEQQERLFRERIGSKADWSDPEDVAAYAQMQRSEARKDVLDKLTPDRTCRCCGHQKFASRSWVVSKDGKDCVCRSCFMKAAYLGPLCAEGTVAERIILGMDIRFRFDGQAINSARKATGLSLRAFAEMCGWTESWQRQLEYGSIQTMSPDQMAVLFHALREQKAMPLDLTDPEEL